MEFRKDINGLRAIAVISVLIFHFNNALLPGGFSGVDVFFVISGYLMTKIILGKIENETFSLRGFYMARARRIIPSLAVTCMAVLVLGWFFVRPSEYEDLSKDVLSSIFFVSNFLYLSRSGYFDDSSVNNFLLHTWSLSVEWQFYIVYPLVLLGVCRFWGAKVAKILIALSLFFSFFLSLYGTYNNPDLTYFMFPTRAWAMLAGSAVYVLPNCHSSIRSSAFYSGMALIVMSLFIVTKQTPWPGEMALFPVIGSALIIYSSQKNFFLGNGLSQFIGGISYEIYLVHWPLLVLLRKINIEINIVAFISSVIFISYIINSACARGNVKLIKLACLCACGFSVLIITNNGYADRVPEQYRLTKKEFHEKYYGGAGYPANEVFMLNSSDRKFTTIISGDSFGLQYAREFNIRGFKAAALFDHACLIFPDYSVFIGNKEDIGCSDEYSKLKLLMDSNINASVILASKWDGYEGLLIKKGASSPEEIPQEKYNAIILSQVKRIINDGGSERNYYIIGKPQGTSVDGFSCLAGSSLPGYKLVSNCQETQPRSLVPVNEALKLGLSGYPNVKFVDANDALCKDGNCEIITHSEPVYTDGAHLSIFGAAKVISHLSKSL
ncbi:TPA: acyltransferase [Escherichia coli]|nr:acyltransferase [Escherichia coli]